MNLLHRWLCSSSRWKDAVETQILPWALEGLELGSNVLEVGPGYGMTTELLHDRGEHLTCVEIDRKFAQSLRGINGPAGSCAQGAFIQAWINYWTCDVLGNGYCLFFWLRAKSPCMIGERSVLETCYGLLATTKA